MASSKPAKPTTVLFVRHGQTDTTGKVLPGRAKGLHLSDHGHAQAQAVGARIAALGNVSTIYTSPLERTRETAAAIAKACSLRPVANRGLLECDFGDWTGRKLADLRRLQAWQTVQRYPSRFTFPGGESFAGMAARMNDTVHRLCDAHPGETIVAVSHADTIKAAAANALGTPLDLFQRIVIGPCAITAVTYTTVSPIVLAINSTGDDLTALVPS